VKDISTGKSIQYTIPSELVQEPPAGYRYRDIDQKFVLTLQESMKVRSASETPPVLF
jgi:hypothetical protein